MGRLHVAPMAAVTDRHFRMFIRSLSPLPTLWTEMTWDHAIVERENTEEFMGFSDAEQPVVLQLGGSEPTSLAKAAALGVARGYRHINLNCGCPAGTDGTRRSCYGARLMLDPARVAACCKAMREAVSDDSVVVSVKCRLGVDGRETYEDLVSFVRTVSVDGGVSTFIVHARVAMLGLNAAANRTVPPLSYESVYRLAAEFPHLTIILNGGVQSIEQAAALIARGVHGVMIGRRAVADPFLFASAGALCGSGGAASSRREALETYLAYTVVAQAANWGGGHAATLARALLALVATCPRAPLLLIAT